MFSYFYLSIYATFFYAAAFIILCLIIWKAVKSDDPRQIICKYNYVSIISTGICLVAHIFILDFNNFNFINSLNYTLILLTLFWIILTLQISIAQLGILLLPLNLLALLSIQHEAQTPGFALHSSAVLIHIFTSLSALGFVLIATLIAIVALTLDKKIRGGKLSPFVQTLPSLERLNSGNSQFMAVAYMFLSCSLLIGMIETTDIFLQHISHKVFFSFVSWLVLTSLLVRKLISRPSAISIMTHCSLASVCLMIGFLGSKVVVEYILHL